MVPIKGFIDLSLVDWDGKATCVVFTPGCNFRCPWCQNGPLVLRPNNLPDVPLERVLRYIEENGWALDGVVITGGEPTIWPDLPELCRAFKEVGLPVKLDTNGTNPEMLRGLVEEGLVDYVAMDVKAPLEATAYSKVCGVDAGPFMGRIRESIGFLMGSRIGYEFRTTVVPGLIGPEEVRAICEAIRGCRKYVLQAFRPEGPTIDPSYSEARGTSREELERCATVARSVLGASVVLIRG